MVRTADLKLNWRTALTVAIVAELLYVAGRTWLIHPAAPGVSQELAWNAWRLFFVFLYRRLYRGLPESGSPPGKMTWHPALLLALFLALATPPFGVAVAGPAYLAELALISFPLAALREELFYRALLQRGLERIAGPLPAILVASTLFTLYHADLGRPLDFGQACDIFSAGVLLGVVYQRTRNLALVAVIHLVIDEVIALTPRLSLDVNIVLLANAATAALSLLWWWLDGRRTPADTAQTT